jgi:sugar/nucleoside kinase (ribokinase family)
LSVLQFGQITHRTIDARRRSAGAEERADLGYRSAVPDRFDLLVLGDVNPDLIVVGNVEPAFGQVERIVEDARLTVGGSGAIVACGAARLGLRTAICGVVGDDVFGRFMRDQLGGRGVDVGGLLVEPGRPTGLTVVLARGDDRAILTRPGTIADLHAGRIDTSMLEAARHVHVASYFLQDALRPGLRELFERARANGSTTSVDPNWDPSERWDDGLLDLLPVTDVFLPNAEEAMRITGAASEDEAARALAAAGGVVVVKAGGLGAIAASGDELLRAPAATVDAVDATGAGDAFDAGFLVSRLRGETLERSLAIANACGALSTRALGGVDAQPTTDEVLDTMRTGR